MNDDDLWAAIDRQRLRTVDLLESLEPAEWAHDTLCDGWTVRDVAAHLTLQQLTLGAALRGALRHPGSLNHMIRETARSKAAAPTEQLIAEIRGMVGSRRHNIGVSPLETLIDITVHGQDIAVPIGHSLETSPEATAAAASQAWSYRTSSKGQKKAKVFRSLPFDRYRLTATDISWTRGDGPEVSGPILAILLLLTGRPVGLNDVSGTGADELARHVSDLREERHL